MLSLNDVLIKDDVSKRIRDVTYDKDWKVNFKLMFLPKPELQAMIGRHTKLEFNSKTHQKEEILNNEALSADILNTCVKGWAGITYKWLATQLAIDLSKVENPDEELPFTTDSFQILIKNAYGIDSWILDSIRNAGNFSEKKEEEIKNS